MARYTLTEHRNTLVFPEHQINHRGMVAQINLYSGTDPHTGTVDFALQVQFIPEGVEVGPPTWYLDLDPPRASCQFPIGYFAGILTMLQSGGQCYVEISPGGQTEFILGWQNVRP